MTGDISSWIGRHAANAPDRIAIRFEGNEISYRALHARVLGCANYLHSVHGINPGDRVAYLGFNTPECVILLFACAKLGAIYLPLNWRLTLPELDYVLGHATPKVVIADSPQQEAAVRLVAGHSGCTSVDLSLIHI